MGRWAQRTRRGGGTSYRPIVIDRVFLVEDGGDELVAEFSAPVNETDFTPGAFSDTSAGIPATDVNQETNTSLRYGNPLWSLAIDVGDSWEYSDNVTGIPQPQTGVVGPNV